MVAPLADNGGSSAIHGRVLTALVYLNDGFEGGQTNWPMAGLADPNEVNFRHVYRLREHFAHCQVARGLTVRPLRGSVALFYSLAPNAEDKDWMAWHGSCDVMGGVKWAANFWWHLGLMRRHSRGRPPQQRAPEARRAACEDSSRDCAAWAASGECERNPAYMKAECRRACGVCS